MNTPQIETNCKVLYNLNKIYSSLQEAFNALNSELFGGILPHCIITIGKCNKRVHGFHHAEQWGEGGESLISEICLNPIFFKKREDIKIFSTLLHEMVHLWQYNEGKSSRNDYHNTEFARKMIEVGLQPSNTGKPGGAMTGQQMTHYIIEEGVFETLFKKLKIKIDIGKKQNLSIKRISSKVKFQCPQCNQAAWGKPSLKLYCGDCQKLLEKQ